MILDLANLVFIFEAFWPKLSGYSEVIQEAWQSIPIQTCPISTLNLKLWAATKSLQAWSENKVGHVTSQLALTRELFHKFEIAQEDHVLIVAENWFKSSLKTFSGFGLP
jgi:hypothetical protein